MTSRSQTVTGTRYRQRPVTASNLRCHSPQILEIGPPLGKLASQVYKGSWQEFERRFLELLEQRRSETVIAPELFHGPAVLLCSEPTTGHCHHRLILEYLQDKWGNVQPVHR